MWWVMEKDDLFNQCFYEEVSMLSAIDLDSSHDLRYLIVGIAIKNVWLPL